MIKNKLIVAIAILSSLMIFSPIVKAQDGPVSVNFRGGLNFSTFGGDLDDTKKMIKSQFGIGVDMAVGYNLYFLTGLDYQMKGTKIDPDYGGKTKFNASYLQVPAHLEYKLRLFRKISISAEAGPYFAYGIGGKIKGTEKINTFGDGRLKKFDMGGGIAFGLGFGRNFLKAGCDYGFLDISDIKGVKIRNRNLYITSGFYF